MNHTNFLHASTEAKAEQEALSELLRYLIEEGKYSSIEEGKKDAVERVKFFEQLSLYKDDPDLQAASDVRKMVHALIYGHNLHDPIEANRGYLPNVVSQEEWSSYDLDRLRIAIRRQMVRGKSREELSQFMLERGVPLEHVLKICDYTTPEESRNSRRRQLWNFTLTQFLPAPIACLFIFWVGGIEALNGLMPWAFGGFVVGLAGLALFEKFSGQLALKGKYLSVITGWMASFSLVAIFLLSEPWSPEVARLAGGWRGMIAMAVVNVIIYIGPYGAAAFFALFAFVFMVLAWSFMQELEAK